MKVAFIASDNNASSGAFLSMANLAVQLNKMGVETVLFIPSDGAYIGPGDGEAVLKQFHLKYYKMPSISWIVEEDFPKTILTTLGQIKNIIKNKRYAKKLARILQSEHVDIVHINTSYSYYGAFAAQYAKLPFVWHIREFLEEDQEKRFYFRKYAYRLMNRASLVIAISDSICEKYKPMIRKIKTIYNGIDIDRFYKPNREIFQSEPLKLCYVGGLSPMKGTDDLIEACQRLNDAGLKDAYRVLIAGRGDAAYENALRNNIQQYGLENVTFLGYRTDVPDVMCMADVSIVASRREAFGRVTVEAMLTGNLVLGADSGATKELLQDEKFGVLYHCGDPESIKEQVIFILQNKDRLKKRAYAARNYMAENMTAEKNAQNIYQEYVRIIEENKHGR